MQQVPRHLLGADRHRRLPDSVRTEVYASPGVRSQHLEQAVQVATRARTDELLGDEPMLRGSDVEPRGLLTRGDLLPRAPGELPTGRNRPADAPGDFVERRAEDVVQHEDDTLGRAEPLQHYQQ